MFVYLISLAFLCHQIVSQTTTQCPGTWSDWVPASGASCNDTCGMCGQIQMERTCQPAGCQCDDPSETTMMAACGENVCLFPKASCCSPYEKRTESQGGLICALANSTTTSAAPETTTSSE